MLSQTKAFYSKSMVPSKIDSTSFVRFAGKIDGIMSQFLTTGQMLSFRVKIEDSPSAYIDFTHKLIVLPKWYVSEETLRGMVKDENPVDVAIALVNGSAAHESLHGKWTVIEGDYDKWLKKFFSDEIEKFGMDLVGSIVNICEDIYIESRNDNPYQIFTDAKNSILFRNFEVDETNIVNTIVQFKNKNHRESLKEVLSDEGFDALQAFVDGVDSIGANSRIKEFRTAIEIFGIENDKVDGKGKDGGESGEGESGEGEGAGKSIDKMSSTIEKLAAAIASHDIDADELAKALESEIRREALDKLSKKSHHDGFTTAEVIEVDINEISTGREELDLPEVDSSFVKVLRMVRHKNTTKGEQRTKGSAINASQLYRISTDQKVFAEPHRYDAKAEEIEIGILIDASGSMSGRLFDKVCSEVIGFSDAMVQSRIPHFVDAHTSEGKARNEIPMMIRVLKSRVGGTTVDRRGAMELLKGGVNLRQNYDGFMIEKSCEHFSKKETRKILIVLSDGEPYSPDYCGIMAINHTKQKIAEARRKGYIVISISLVDDVVESNDYIYGKEWNIDASMNLSTQMQNIIANVSRR